MFRTDQNGTIVIRADSTGQGARDDRSSHDVPRSALPAGVDEDAVLLVPVVAGTPQWGREVVDHAERRRLLARAKAALEQLKKRDPGGDITL